MKTLKIGARQLSQLIREAVGAKRYDEEQADRLMDIIERDDIINATIADHEPDDDVGEDEALEYAASDVIDKAHKIAQREGIKLSDAGWRYLAHLVDMALV